MYHLFLKELMSTSTLLLIPCFNCNGVELDYSITIVFYISVPSFIPHSLACTTLQHISY